MNLYGEPKHVCICTFTNREIDSPEYSGSDLHFTSSLSVSTSSLQYPYILWYLLVSQTSYFNPTPLPPHPLLDEAHNDQAHVSVNKHCSKSETLLLSTLTHSFPLKSFHDMLRMRSFVNKLCIMFGQ